MQDDPTPTPTQHSVLTVIAALRHVFQADYWIYTPEEAAELAALREEEAEMGEEETDEGPEAWYRQDFEQARVVSTFFAALFEAAKLPVLANLNSHLVDESDSALMQLEALSHNHTPLSPAERIKRASHYSAFIEALESVIATTLFSDGAARDRLTAAAEAAGLPAGLEIPSVDLPGGEGWSDQVLLIVQELEHRRRSTPILPPQGPSSTLIRVNTA